ncbi:MAG TPA: hypothetical protein VHF88_07490 [Thermoleophilaceae bacterium]|nr:hypothetical protein [Thermoleophilaceae bacterium]
MPPTASHDGAENAYELAYDEAVLAVSSQQAAIDSFRGRAGLLLSGAAIATSFLGGQALRTGNPGVWSWISIAVFALLGLATLAILWPRNWKFEADPADIVATYIEAEEPLPVVDIQRDLALHRASVLEENGKQFRRLVWSFRAAGILLVVEIVTWTIDLATKVD